MLGRTHQCGKQSSGSRAVSCVGLAGPADVTAHRLCLDRAVTHRLTHGACVTLVPSLEHSLDQGLLGSESILHAALGNTHGARNRIYGQRRRAALNDDSLRSVQQAVAIKSLTTSAVVWLLVRRNRMITQRRRHQVSRIDNGA